MHWERVIIAAGGTAGHIFPGVAIAQELRERHPGLEVHFAGGGTTLERRILEREGFPWMEIRSGGLRGKSTVVKLRNLVRVTRGLGQSVAAVRRLRPSLVIGVGGYTSGPMVLAGILLRRPTLLHEQNYLPGLTNRLLAPLVREVAISFRGTAQFLGGRGVWTGNPLRRGFHRSAGPSSEGGPLRLLIFGGSQGAHRINQVVVEALPRIKALPGGVEVVHATGEADREWIAGAYQEQGLPARVDSFLEEMAEAYRRSDLVICRAGATTCAELTALGRPAILIPYPLATGGHQLRNAEQLRNEGGAVVIQESELRADTLVDAVERIVSEPGRLRQMASASASLGLPDAAGRVASLAEKLMRAQ